MGVWSVECGVANVRSSVRDTNNESKSGRKTFPFFTKTKTAFFLMLLILRIEIYVLIFYSYKKKGKQ